MVSTTLTWTCWVVPEITVAQPDAKSRVDPSKRSLSFCISFLFIGEAQILHALTKKCKQNESVVPCGGLCLDRLIVVGCSQ